MHILVSLMVNTSSCTRMQYKIYINNFEAAARKKVWCQVLF